MYSEQNTSPFDKTQEIIRIKISKIAPQCQRESHLMKKILAHWKSFHLTLAKSTPCTLFISWTIQKVSL